MAPRSPRRDDARPEDPIRLQVYLARSGVASRRASEELITAGRVRVNGRVVRELGTKVDPARDVVLVNGRRVQPERPVWVALNKPQGYVTTRDDPQRRSTVYDLLPPELHHLFHVGRLDLNSEGLLLLTNEGQVANRLMHPRYGVTKEYLADVEGTPTHATLARLVHGIELDDGRAEAQEAELVYAGASSSRVRLVLQEGRYREVRRMFDAIGHPVRGLRRVRFGPIQLASLARGAWRYLGTTERQRLQAAGME
jgi:23S rRNA pseudouridine2605 synthase